MSTNRQQRRELARKLRKKGLPREVAEAYAERLSSETINNRYCWEGEKVKLDLLQLTSYKEWKSEDLGPNRKKYQEWVLAHANDEFTVEYDPIRKANNAKDIHSIVQLKEDETEPKWLFWAGDLIQLPGQTPPWTAKQKVEENEAKRVSNTPEVKRAEAEDYIQGAVDSAVSALLQRERNRIIDSVFNKEDNNNNESNT